MRTDSWCRVDVLRCETTLTGMMNECFMNQDRVARQAVVAGKTMTMDD
jgi:hypothetical protein